MPAAVIKPEVLSQTLTSVALPGSAMLLTTGGSLLSYTGSFSGEELTASVIANAWATYSQSDTKRGPRLNFLYVDCQEGRTIVTQVLPGLLLSLMSDKTLPLHELQAKLLVLKEHLSVTLEQAFPAGQAGTLLSSSCVTSD
mmetsp:Transcript_1215/g.3768  ORF Transcript_1215/g.3768 Transcript_1215/m.3768 type:complete len:141 (-) Transcript_1215:192-614(-)